MRISASKTAMGTDARWSSALNLRWFPVFACAAILCSCVVFAQTPVPAPSLPQSAHHQPRAAQSKPSAAVVAPDPQPVIAAPPTPHWPVNETPAQASVTWDSHGLRINAVNSSLRQIMSEVGAETGVKVEGLSSDERVFGEYGPGKATDVLSQLLRGSNYNVLMIGDQGQGTPRQILLSARRAGGPSVARRENSGGFCLDRFHVGP